MAAYYLAQLNLARLVAPTADPQVAEFVALLDPIDERAEQAPGFVWRLQSASGNATEVRAFDDALTIVNLTVWETPEALFDFTYRDNGHRDAFRRRLEWFERNTEHHLVLWWIPTGTIPTVGEALERLDHLAQHGATSRAFTFKQRFPMPEEAIGEADRRATMDDLSTRTPD